LEFVRLPTLLIIFHFFGANVLTLFVSVIITQSISLLIYFVFCFRLLSHWWKKFIIKWPINIITIIRTYGKWSVLSNIFSDLLSNARNYFIKFLISTEAVAIYNIAKSMMDSLYQIFPSNKILMIFLPYKISKDDLKEKYYHIGIKYATFFYTILMFAGYIGGTLIISLFFEKYVSSLPIFYIMLPVFLVFGLSDFVNSYLYVLRYQKILFYRTILKNISVITLTFLLVPIFGIYGLGIEYIITNLILIYSLYFVLKKMYPKLTIRISDFAISFSDIKYAVSKSKYFLYSQSQDDDVK